MTDRELDALIGEKVMGLCNIRTCEVNSVNYLIHGEQKGWILGNLVPKYSTTIEAAWQIVEKLKEVDPTIFHKSRALKLSLSFGGTGYPWRAEFDLEKDNAGDDQTNWCAYADTAPKAICMASLKTVGVDI